MTNFPGFSGTELLSNKALTLVLKNMEANRSVRDLNYDISWLWEEFDLRIP
jgi:hypothetical protein